MSVVDGSVPEPGRLARQWGHWAPWMLVAAVVATIGHGVWPPPAGSAAAALVPVLLVAWVVPSWLLLRHHDRRLCEDCMAGMPLDPAGDARRFDRRLAVVHLAGDRRVVLAYVTVLVASHLLLLGARAAAGPGPGELAWALVQASLVYLVLAHGTHRRLQPWCRHCAGGGGGDGAAAPDPAPTGSRRG